MQKKKAGNTEQRNWKSKIIEKYRIKFGPGPIKKGPMKKNQEIFNQLHILGDFFTTKQPLWKYWEKMIKTGATEQKWKTNGITLGCIFQDHILADIFFTITMRENIRRRKIIKLGFFLFIYFNMIPLYHKMVNNKCQEQPCPFKANVFPGTFLLFGK